MNNPAAHPNGPRTVRHSIHNGLYFNFAAYYTTRKDQRNCLGNQDKRHPYEQSHTHRAPESPGAELTGPDPLRDEGADPFLISSGSKAVAALVGGAVVGNPQGIQARERQLKDKSAMTYTIEKQAAGVGDLPQAIFRHWIHSREEDTGDVEVYRPEGFAFPPSFGRDGFEMRKNGQFIQDDIGPADGVVQVLGRWTSLGSQRVSVSFEGTDREGYSFEIVTVDDTILQIRREAQQQPGRYRSEPAMDETQMQTFRDLPVPSSFRLLDFERARVITLESFPLQFILRVSGTKPYVNMDVELVPLVYIRQPEYWGIEVVGSLRGIGLPALAPYRVSIPLAGILGTRGIEVIGATRRERFDLVPGGPSQT